MDPSLGGVDESFEVAGRQNHNKAVLGSEETVHSVRAEVSVLGYLVWGMSTPASTNKESAAARFRWQLTRASARMRQGGMSGAVSRSSSKATCCQWPKSLGGGLLVKPAGRRLALGPLCPWVREHHSTQTTTPRSCRQNELPRPPRAGQPDQAQAHDRTRQARRTSQTVNA